MESEFIPTERFTSGQLQEFQDAFTLFDTKDRGMILSHELRDMLKIVGLNPTDNELEKLIVVIDDDANGKVDFNEFLTLVGKLHTEEKDLKEAYNAFHAFDWMGNGYVVSNDLKEALMFVVEKATNEEREDLIQFFNLDTDRKIYFEEFKDMIIVRPKP